MAVDPHLVPGWNSCTDNELRDLIELNERGLERVQESRRFRGRAAIIRRYQARLSVLQAEEDRRIREST